MASFLVWPAVTANKFGKDVLVNDSASASSIQYVRKIFRKSNILTPWYSHLSVRIKGLEMLVFPKHLRIYQMDDSQWITKL